MRMRAWRILMYFLFVPFAQAENVDLEKSFQIEYSYLISQREALLRQKKMMEKKFDERIGLVKNRLDMAQKELAKMTVKNDDESEALAGLDKKRRDLNRGETSFEAIYRKSAKVLNEAERSLRFQERQEKAEVIAPAGPGVGSLSPIFSRSKKLLEALASSERFSGYYLDEQDTLRRGEVTRLGQVAAFLSGQHGMTMLGPSGNGTLKALNRSTDSFYVFDNLYEAAQFKLPGTWVERLADSGPALFLLMMLGVVAGLFFVLVKI